MCVCGCASDVCVCVCTSDVYVCTSDVCVCARASDVCVRALQMCVCALQMCARKTSHTARLLLQQSRASYTLASCLRAVLISSPDTWDWTRMHALAVMHRLCEDVDSAKIKVPSYKYRYFTRGIDASYRHKLYRYIDESLHPYYLHTLPSLGSLSEIHYYESSDPYYKRWLFHITAVLLNFLYL